MASQKGQKAGGVRVTHAPKFTVRNMDRSVDPRKDFFRYAAGGWVKRNPVPPDKTWWGSFAELDEWNLALLRRIVERCSKDRVSPGGSTVRLVGDFYRSAVDIKRIEKEQFSPVEGLWKLVDDLGSTEDLPRVASKLHSEGTFPFYSPFSKADDKNSSVYAFFMYQGGLSLPDRDYYMSGKFSALKEKYLAHVNRMFVLSGATEREASRWARSVLGIETALAKPSRARADLRDREKNYNRMETDGLASRYPNLELVRYLDGVGVKKAPYVVIGQPEFFDSLDGLIKKKGLDDWKAYLRWHVLHAYAPHLHSKVESEDFGFFHRKLLGQREPEPRWKRATKVIDEMIGEALGKLYVEEHFPEEARRKASLLVDDLRKVFAKKLGSLPWMTEKTRKQALGKFERFTVKIGHPVKFRDYSSLRIEPDDYAGNVRRSRTFEVQRQASRVGGQVDRNEWFMTPPTVNAYFEETTNEIVFPAGILQPSFFDKDADDAVNYGSIGVVIGHEITHGYDDQGRRYDAHGNLKDWWTHDDEKEFGRRARAVVRAYSALEMLPGMHVNGELTLGENIADLGGVSIAYEALERRLKEEPSKRRLIDGMTPEQRFFVSHAQTWRETVRPQELRRALTIDPHSPGEVRATLPVVNHPAFDDAFPPSRRERVVPKIGVW